MPFGAGAKLPCGGGEQRETAVLGATRRDWEHHGCSWPSTQGQAGLLLGLQGLPAAGRALGA